MIEREYIFFIFAWTLSIGFATWFVLSTVCVDAAEAQSPDHLARQEEEVVEEAVGGPEGGEELPPLPGHLQEVVHGVQDKEDGEDEVVPVNVHLSLYVVGVCHCKFF